MGKRHFPNIQSVSRFPYTTPKVATPTFSPVPGNYTRSQSVTVSCVANGSKIYLYNEQVDTDHGIDRIVCSNIHFCQYFNKSHSNEERYAHFGCRQRDIYNPSAGTYTGAQSDNHLRTRRIKYLLYDKWKYTGYGIGDIFHPRIGNHGRHHQSYDGYIKFKTDMSVPNGKVWNGIFINVKFKSLKSNGQTTINCRME